MSDDFEIAYDGKLGGGAGEAADGYRRWSTEDKARILAESCEPGVKVVEVARRNGLPAQRLYSWRSQARTVLNDACDERGITAAAGSPHTLGQPMQSTRADEEMPQFVPVMMTAPASSSPPSSTASGTIEIVISNTVVRVSGDVEASTLATVFAAIKEAS